MQKRNNMNVEQKKIIGISQIGGLLGILYSFQNKSGVLKGVGNYFIGTLTLGLGAMAYFNLKKD
jgi:hypothetical protein